MRTRRRLVLTVVALIVIAVALGSLGAASRIEQAVVPDATWVVASPQSGCDPDCLEFVEAVGPSLRLLVAEGNALADLGQSRSRNILELTVRMDRFKEAGIEFSNVVAETVVPETLQPEIETIQVHIDSANRAIDDSISAIRSFDWELLGNHVDTFANEIAVLSELAAELNL